MQQFGGGLLTGKERDVVGERSAGDLKAFAFAREHQKQRRGEGRKKLALARMGARAMGGGGYLGKLETLM